MEAGRNARLEENLNYNSRGLRSTFSYFRDTPDDAERYGRTDEHPADRVSIANLAYANRNGNGDTRRLQAGSVSSPTLRGCDGPENLGSEIDPEGRAC